MDEISDKRYEDICLMADDLAFELSKAIKAKMLAENFYPAEEEVFWDRVISRI